MEIIKASTQRGQRFIYSYNSSSARTLSDVYLKCSSRKQSAYDSCLRAMHEEGGHDFRIIGSNCMQFTVAWRVADGLRVETAYNSYIVK